MMRHRHYLSTLFDPSRVWIVTGDAPAQPWVRALVELAQAAMAESGSADGAHESRCVLELVPLGQLRPATGAESPAHAPVETGVDLIVLAVADHEVSAALASLTGHAVGNVLIVALDARDQWANAVRALGARLLGPASTGFVRPHLGLNLSCMGAAPPSGEVALVTQSGALGAAMLDWAREEGTGFSLLVALGAEADVDLAQVLDYLANDPYTRSVIVYVEAVHAARPFISALRALALVKPVIVLKGHRRETRVDKSWAAGVLRPAAARTMAAAKSLAAPGVPSAPSRASIPDASDDPSATRATGATSATGASKLPSSPDTAGGLTHSGALATADAVYEAVVRRTGAVQIQIFAQLETTARYLAARSVRVGPRLGVVSNGRGPAVLAIDQAQASRIVVSDPDPSRIHSVDVGFEATPQAIVDALRRAGESSHLDALLLVVSPYPMLDRGELVALLARHASSVGLPVFACLLGGEGVRDSARQLERSGIPIFATPEAAVNAYANVARFHHNQRLMLQSPRPLSDLPDPDFDAARKPIERALAAGHRLLDEVESKALLTAFELPMTGAVRAQSAREAVAIADRIGYPVALKVLSPDIAHKRRAGGVVLEVRDADHVVAAFGRIADSTAALMPPVRFEGVSVQPMHRGAGSLELYAGVFRDPLWGPVIVFGAGGSAIELIADETLELPPLNAFLARQMIARTRVATRIRELFDDDVRHEAASLAIERVLLRLSEIVCELPQVRELDINPLALSADGRVEVLDARVVVEPAPPTGPRYAHMAIMPYPTDLEQTFVIRTGATVRIRPIRPEDAEPLQTFVRNTSPQTRYFRFVSTLAELPPKLLQRFTQIDYDSEIALVVTPDADSADNEIVGVVRYMRNPDGRTCEFAIAILDAWHGKGLGGHLMRTLIELARSRGLQRIEGHVLALNQPMLKLMRELGFTSVPDPSEPDMRKVWMELAPAPAPA